MCRSNQSTTATASLSLPARAVSSSAKLHHSAIAYEPLPADEDDASFLRSLRQHVAHAASNHGHSDSASTRTLHSRPVHRLQSLTALS